MRHDRVLIWDLSFSVKIVIISKWENNNKLFSIFIMEKKTKKEEYTARDIYVLEGLEPVRRRPGMYIGSTGPEGLHHLIYECLDNAIDEAVAGYAKDIKVRILPGEKVEIRDDGRGIPVDIHPQTKKSALETVMCTLHAGGKFGAKAYKVAGGLHGVGVSVVNALSDWLRVEVCRDGFLWSQEYQQGKPKTKVKKEKRCQKRGTAVIFHPDPLIFREIKFSLKKILKHIREQAFLVEKTKFTLLDEREEPPFIYQFYFEGGLKSFLKYLIAGEKLIQKEPFYVKGEREGILVEAVFTYVQDIQGLELSFANNIRTQEGGMHLAGFRTALTKTLTDYAKKNDLLKGLTLTGEDVREGLLAIVSVKIANPQFEGQTKAKLGNPEAKSAVEVVVGRALADFLEKNPDEAKAIIGKCLLASKARQAAKAAKEGILKKILSEGLSLPGKLSDCSSRKPEERELFIVEGDSAGGSAKQARDRRFQAILPLKGKILNVEKTRIDRVLSSEEIKALIIALGTSIAQDFDIEKIKYHKIVLAADADSDGKHIITLLLTLFYRYFPQIIERGYLYIAQPPLYRIQSGKVIKYAYSDQEKEKIVKELKGEKRAIDIQRYKGLGEMNPEQLWQTTLNPEKRVLKKVTIEDAQEADRIFEILMGNEVGPRKKFIQVYAREIKDLDI